MHKDEISFLIKELIEKITIPVNKISVTEEGSTTLGGHQRDSTTLWFSVEVDQPHLFSSNGGEALFALNHIARRVVESKMLQNVENKGEFLGPEILVDINDFQRKRVESIRAVAHMMAERARYFKSSIEIDPMSAFERRVIHEFLADATDLKTESEGVGPSRRVVIKYIGTSSTI